MIIHGKGHNRNDPILSSKRVDCAWHNVTYLCNIFT
nr:MAG TPA: hypothetical protein [Caudoviricetes sp.]